MKTKSLTDILMLICFITLICSCSNRSSQPTVKPALSNNSNQNNPLVDSQPVRTAALEIDEIDMLSIRHERQVMTINSACAFYCDAYGGMPEKLEDILSGFMFIWPENLFNGGPVKILNVIPDPENPNHKGNVYYERVNDYKASIHFINISRDESDPGKTVVAGKSLEILSDWAMYATAPENEKNVEPGRTFKDMNSEERFEKGYWYAATQQLANLFIDSMQRNQKLNEPFIDLIENGNFFILKDGWKQLETYFSTGKSQYEIGSVGDSGWIYFKDSGEHPHVTCLKYAGTEDNPGYFDDSIDCLKTAEPTKVYFKTEALKEITIPENRVITKVSITQP